MHLAEDGFRVGDEEVVRLVRISSCKYTKCLTKAI